MKTQIKTQESVLSKMHKLVLAVLFVSSVVSLAVIIQPRYEHIREFLTNFSSQHYFITVFVLASLLTLFIKYIHEFLKTNSLTSAGLNTYDYYKLPMLRGRWKRRFSTMRKGLLKKIVTQENNTVTEDVLTNPDEIQKRYRDLLNAMTLGNNFKHKVKIYTKIKDKINVMEASVWYANSQHVTLKGGAVLPVKSILKVEY